MYVPNMMDDEAHARIHARQGQGKRVPGRILHVAWQCKEKGSFDLIRAMAHSKAATSCHMVGVVAPENHQLMQSEIESLGLAGRVTLTGPLYGEDLAREFEEASAFVLPTHREGPEGFPMVVLEAMMYGVPVVANNVGNIEEMLTGDNAKPAGRLLDQVDPVDPGELAMKIDELLLSSSEAERLGRNGRERVQDEYLASHVVPNLVALLEGIVGTSGT
ncbi:MAG: glycosyltransferase family 4 protein [Acidobacteria bacterium]|nr:glycosyltransferase family 4 protein [Acidobacteriota bacterium]